jgi:polar amino acid transport system substrate-binding protein
LPAGAPPIVLVTVEGRSDCLSLLQDRSIDAATTDESILSGLAAQDPTPTSPAS